MSVFDLLSAGGVAVAGRTGSGKSSLFHGSRYVLDVCITDPGSLGHRQHHMGGGEVHLLKPNDLACSPIEFVRRWVEKCEREKRLWLLDSWSALEWQQCAWYKAANHKPSMSQPDHKVIVNQLRDLALELATGHGFTLFNTGNGGVIRVEDGPPIQTPKGTLTGYPSLSGCTPGTETVLARWSSVWVIVPGTPDRGPDDPSLTPRGLMLPWDDFRGGDYGHYVPLKDQYSILSAGTIPARNNIPERRMRVDPVSPPGVCHIDVLLERVEAKWGDRKVRPTRRGKPAADQPKAADGPQGGPEEAAA